MNPAPIALFVYNRPEHTRRTIDSLSRNVGASNSILHIFSDAAKTCSDESAVQIVRTLIKGIGGFKNVVIKEQSENLGLAQSIISGVSSLSEEYGRVIVLEDDLETSPYFLKFMNEALDFYEHTPEVMHVSGFRYPVKSFESEETFFLHVPLCWGWATWSRAWDSYRKDLALMSQFDKKAIHRFNFGNSYPFWLQLELNKSRKIDTWFIFWYANLFLRGGLALFPARSLVQNIGMDNSGTNSGLSDDYHVHLSSTPIRLSHIALAEDALGFEYHRKFFGEIHLSIIKRIVGKIRRTLRI
jgi:GT2 family glycosyltransferase